VPIAVDDAYQIDAFAPRLDAKARACEVHRDDDAQRRWLAVPVLLRVVHRAGDGGPGRASAECCEHAIGERLGVGRR